MSHARTTSENTGHTYILVFIHDTKLLILLHDKNIETFRTDVDKPPPPVRQRLLNLTGTKNKRKRLISPDQAPLIEELPCLLDPSLGDGRNGGLFLPTPALVVAEEALLLPLAVVILVFVLLVPFPVRAG